MHHAHDREIALISKTSGSWKGKKKTMPRGQSRKERAVKSAPRKSKQLHTQNTHQYQYPHTIKQQGTPLCPHEKKPKRIRKLFTPQQE